MEICILTIGTRGDVQPYIALGQGLEAAGHAVTVATLAEFKSFVEDYGLKHAALRGNFLGAAQNTLGKQRVGNPLSLLRQYVDMARDTLLDEWEAARECDVLIYNPAAIGGFHIAEKLEVPAFAAFPAPLYSPTREFPSPFFPFNNLGPFNKLSHRLFAALGPSMYRRAINDWRRDTLGLPAAKGEMMLRGQPVRKLYAYSQEVVARPADWDDSSIVTGYWFLDAPDGWQPDPALVNFLEAGPPPVYIGFGSMFMNGGETKTRLVIEAVKLAGQRAVLASGWGGMGASSLPEGIFMLEAVPHDWLFPKMAAIAHHGGAGTTGASLRAGLPTIICPFVGDQPFWGRRVAAMGVGPEPIPQSRLSAGRLAEAITLALEDDEMRRRSAALGEKLRSEKGVGRACAYIHQHI